MFKKILESYKTQVSKSRPITNDKQMNFIRKQYWLSMIIPSIFLFIYLLLILQKFIYYDFALVDAELIHAYSTSYFKSRTSIFKERKFMYNMYLREKNTLVKAINITIWFTGLVRLKK